MVPLTPTKSPTDISAALPLLQPPAAKLAPALRINHTRPHVSIAIVVPLVERTVPRTVAVPSDDTVNIIGAGVLPTVGYVDGVIGITVGDPPLAPPPLELDVLVLTGIVAGEPDAIYGFEHGNGIMFGGGMVTFVEVLIVGTLLLLMLLTAYAPAREKKMNTDTYAICKLANGSTIKIVKYRDRWFLDGDLPTCIGNMCF